MELNSFPDGKGGTTFGGQRRACVDVTNRPAPSIMAGRPVNLILEYDREDAPEDDR